MLLDLLLLALVNRADSAGHRRSQLCALAGTLSRNLTLVYQGFKKDRTINKSQFLVAQIQVQTSNYYLCLRPFSIFFQPVLQLILISYFWPPTTSPLMKSTYHVYFIILYIWCSSYYRLKGYFKWGNGRGKRHDTLPPNNTNIRHLKSLLKTFIVIKKWHNGVVMNSANHSADILELIPAFARQLKKFKCENFTVQ